MKTHKPTCSHDAAGVGGEVACAIGRFTAGRIGLITIGLIALAMNAGIASGDWEQTQKLLADDGAAFDYFGISVALSGDLAVVGAFFDDDAGQQSGSAYVFDVTTGQQIRKFIADDGASEDQFGESVAVSDHTVIIGAPYDDDNGSESGSAYIFDVATGQQLWKLIPDDGRTEDLFGYSVSISGDHAIIGAPRDNDAGQNSGSAYVFNVTTGQQLHKLTANDAAAFDWFGVSVAISGDTAVIGAYLDDDLGDWSGAAYVFDIVTGEQLRKLTAQDGQAHDLFGLSVAISGNVIVVGACGDDDAGSASGSAYAFNTVTGEQLWKLMADDAAVGDEFGISVSVSGELALIGASEDDNAGEDSGSAYLFDVTTGHQLGKLTAADAAGGDEFGFAVSVSEGIAVSGAWKDDDMGDRSGSAYVFCPSSCPADFDGDGDVDSADLLYLLGAWGTPDGDVDGDGDTDTADLLALLGAWGGCP